MDYFIQDTAGSWIMLWTDECAEKALKRRYPNLKRLKKSFVDFINSKETPSGNAFTPSALLTVGIGNPNNRTSEVSFRTWTTNYEDWLIDQAVRQETFDNVYVIEITEVHWNDISARAFIFCIC